MSTLVLNGCVYVGASLSRLFVFSIFDVRAGFGMNTKQSVLAFIPLIGGVVGVVISRACAGCVVGLPVYSKAVPTLSGVGSAPQLLE